MQKSDHSGPTLLLQNVAPTGVPGMARKLSICGCIQRRLFFELRHLPSENAMLKLSLCVCIRRGLNFKCYHPKREKVNSPPSFCKRCFKSIILMQESIFNFLKKWLSKININKKADNFHFKIARQIGREILHDFYRFLWFAIRPQREAKFTPLIFIKSEYRKNGHLLKRYKNHTNWYVSIIPVGWCLGPMPCNALKTNRKST